MNAPLRWGGRSVSTSICITTEFVANVCKTHLVPELAHIRRFDLVVNLRQRLVESLLFFHPTVW